MPQSDELALKCAREFADSKGIPVEVCDINTFGGRIKAWMKGVNTSPTIIVGNSRVQGEFTQEQLRSKLQSCITQSQASSLHANLPMSSAQGKC
jgi:glutaredoxin